MLLDFSSSKEIAGTVGGDHRTNGGRSEGPLTGRSAHIEKLQWVDRNGLAGPYVASIRTGARAVSGRY